MDLNKQFASPEAETKGNWFKEGDARFKVASIHSPAYQDAVADAVDTHRELFRRASRRNASPGAKKAARLKRREITRDAMAEHLLLDWENVTSEGQPIPFSREAAREMMLKYPKFADLIAEFSMDEFSDEADQEGIDNLKND